MSAESDQSGSNDWAESYKVPPEKNNRSTPFYALGRDSLKIGPVGLGPYALADSYAVCEAVYVLERCALSGDCV